MRRERTVEDLMRTAVLAVRPDDGVQVARDQMRLADIRHLPVIDERNHVIGVVSDRDLAHVAGERPVREVMHHPARTVRRRTPAHEAATLLRENKIGSLPVVAVDGELVGIITVSDFLDVACEALGGHPELAG